MQVFTPVAHLVMRRGTRWVCAQTQNQTVSKEKQKLWDPFESFYSAALSHHFFISWFSCSGLKEKRQEESTSQSEQKKKGVCEKSYL